MYIPTLLFTVSALEYCWSLHVCTSIDDDSRTEWERQREREEFARTARVVQPLGSSLTSRFTRSQEEASTKEPAEEEVSSLCSSVLNCLFNFHILWSRIVTAACDGAHSRCLMQCKRLGLTCLASWRGRWKSGTHTGFSVRGSMSPILILGKQLLTHLT